MTGGKRVRIDLTNIAGGKCIQYMSKKQPKIMKDELERYKNSTYLLNRSGKLVKIYLDSLSDYDHNQYELHHFISYQAYIKNPKWYEERGIKQKLILVSKICHEHIENRGIRILTDEEFKDRYKISRWELSFNTRYSSC
jgi:hypothetical protein